MMGATSLPYDAKYKEIGGPRCHVTTGATSGGPPWHGRENKVGGQFRLGANFPWEGGLHTKRLQRSASAAPITHFFLLHLTFASIFERIFDNDTKQDKEETWLVPKI